MLNKEEVIKLLKFNIIESATEVATNKYNTKEVYIRIIDDVIFIRKSGTFNVKYIVHVDEINLVGYVNNMMSKSGQSSFNRLLKVDVSDPLFIFIKDIFDNYFK